MLAISVLSGIIVYLMMENILDAILGPAIGYHHMIEYFAAIKGEEKRGKKKKLGKPEKRKELKMNTKTFLSYALPISVLIFGFCLLFFRSRAIAFFFSMSGLFYPRVVMNKKIKKRKELLNIQLREALQSISNSLKAGSSLQSAIERCLEDVKRVLKGQPEKPIVEELEIIVYELQLGKSLDEALIAFQNRADLEDVTTFVNAAIITKEKGGNLTEVMANVCEMIGDKIQIRREIMTMTAGKRAEAKLLTFAPVVLVLVLSVLSPSYMKPMYETLVGKIMMITGIVLLLINYFIGKKIIDINV